MEHNYLNEILIIFAAAVGVVVLFLRLNLPAILGYLLVGVVMGPHGLALIADTEHTRAFAEFGVVFLLFTIGLEFSLPLLIRMKGAVLGLGGSQVLLTTSVTTLVGLYFGLPIESALVLGGVVAMSSTALVIRQLTQQVELHSRHGRNAVGILLFQDLAVIPFLILVATTTEATSEMPLAVISTALGEGLLALVLILALGRWVLRPLFRGIARLRSTELFTLTALMVALGAAGLTYQLGLSLALGAFLAGMMLGETEFRHQIEAEIRPFRDVLLGLFFITIGMLLNVQLLPTLWPGVLLLLAVLVVLKLVFVAGICRLAGDDSAIALRTGLILAHGGEFGFAILAVAFTGHLFSPEVNQTVLAALLISMGLAPLVIRSNNRLTSIMLPKGSVQSNKAIERQIATTAEGLRGHVIICGYGRVGQNVARFIEGEGVPYMAMDLDSVLVENAIKAKEPVSYGDAANLHLLEAAGLARATALVISLDDVESALKILHTVRLLNRDIPILVRTRDDSHLIRLQEAGATEVVPETLEASLILSSHLLLTLKVPMPMVYSMVSQIRKGRYTSLRHVFPGEEAVITTPRERDEQLRAIELPQDTRWKQRPIGELDFEDLGVTVTAIQRHNSRIANPSADTVLRTGDTLILFGTSSALEGAETVLLSKQTAVE